VISFSGDDRFLNDADLVRRAERFGNYVEVELQAGAEAQELLRRAVEVAEIQRFEVADPSLREIFVTSVGGEATGEEDA
jgi:ABC-type uncharacterized transport system ATPase subunit